MSEREDEPTAHEAAPTLLFADDNPTVRHLLKSVFGGRGAEILEASNGSEALERILAESPSLVILDVMMPEMSGWEVLRYLRSREGFTDLPIVMLTAIGEMTNEMTSPLFGASAHLDKPFRIEDIDAVVCRLLAEKGYSLEPFEA
jgi:CheY-like chemotaxis protein